MSANKKTAEQAWDEFTARVSDFCYFIIGLAEEAKEERAQTEEEINALSRIQKVCNDFVKYPSMYKISELRECVFEFDILDRLYSPAISCSEPLEHFAIAEFLSFSNYLYEPEEFGDNIEELRELVDELEELYTLSLLLPNDPYIHDEDVIL